MPYIGNAPYQGLVDSGNIVDGGVQTIDLANSSVTTAKVADSGITTAKLASASVTAAKLASDVTDLITVGGSPKITSVVVTNSSYTALDDTAVDVAGGYIKITGTGFSNGCQVLINNTAATSVTFISATEVRAQVPATSAGTYVIYVVNSDGGVGIRVNGITFSSIPAWSTSSTLSSAGSDEAISIQLSASSNSAITYTLQAGSTLPTGLSLSSSGLLSGTIVGLQNETTYNFTVLAIDVENQDTSRAFSITITVGLPDDYYKSVVLHLPGNGTNLATNNQFLDSSTNNFSITRSGNATQGTFSPFSQTGWGNYFDGSGDYLSVANNAALSYGTGAFTIEGFFYTSATNQYGSIFTDENSLGTAGLTLLLNPTVGNGQLVLYGNGTLLVTATGKYNDNAWHHFAISRDSTNLRLYVDGVYIGASASGSTNFNASQPLLLMSSPIAGRTISGYLSNFRTIKGTALYTGTSSITVPTAPLTAISGTSLLTCQSNRFIDNSTNNFTITRNGDTRVVAFSPFNPTASWSAATYGGSGYFDGSGDYISTTTSATFGTSDFTLDWWVYHIAAPNPCWLWDGAFSSGTYPQIFITTSGTSFRYLNGAGTTLITATITNRLNEWVHYRICRSGSTVRLFINGVYIAQATDSTNYSSTFRGGFGARARDGLEGNQAYFGGFQAVMTALSTTNDNFTPPSGPMTLLSNTVLLLNFTNAGIYDATSKNVLETVGDAKISTTQSKWGGSSIAFDGTGDYLLTNSITGLQALGTGNFTIEMWAYWNSLPGSNNMLIDYRPTTTDGAYPCLYLNGTALYYYVSAANQISATNAVATGAWYHIALCRAQNNTKLFVNGLQVGSTYADTNNYLAGTGRPYIGINGYDGTGSMNGYIDDLRITRDVARYWYNFTPPAKQFKTSYGATPTPATDEYFDYTTLLLAGNGGNTLQNNSFVDSSTNNFTITRNGNTTQGTFSPFSQTGWSNYFNGSSDYFYSVSTDFDVATEDFTAEGWIFPTGDASGSYGNLNLVIGSWASDVGASVNGAWYLGVNSSSKVIGTFFISGTGYSVTSSASVSLNTWQHVAFVRNGNDWYVYLNGVRASTTQSGTIQTQGRGYVGGNLVNGQAGYQFKGYISNVRFVKGTAVYTAATITVPTAPLTAITNTKFLTCQANRFVDANTQVAAKTITLVSTPSVQAFSPFAPAAAYSAATVGGSGYFDGSGDYLSATTAASLGSGDFTVECWVYFTSAPGADTGNIICSYNYYTAGFNGNVVFRLGTSYGGRIFNGQTLVAEISGTFTWPLYTWTHVAWVRSGSTITLYKNGVSIGSMTASTNLSDFANGFVVGASRINGTVGEYSTCYISNLRMVAGTAVYTTAFTPPTAPLTNITNTSLLLNFTNAAVIDNTAKNVLETVADAQISTTQSKFGGASLYFDGSGDRLYEPSNQNYNFGTGDFTIELWVYPISQGGHGSANNDCLIDFRPGANGVYGTLYLFNSGTGVYWYVNSANRITGAAISNNIWTHIAVSRYASNTKLFINGVQSGSTYADTNNYLVAPIMIGEMNDGLGSGNFYGYLDDIRITKGIARYVQNFTPPSAALQLL